MPKLKTKSGAKKRFGRTGTGKVKRNWGHKRHLLINKSKQGKRLRRGWRLAKRGVFPKRERVARDHSGGLGHEAYKIWLAGGGIVSGRGCNKQGAAVLQLYADRRAGLVQH